MRYEIRRMGESRSFPEGDSFLDASVEGGEALFLLGAPFAPDPGRAAILVELGLECLDVHLDTKAEGPETNVLGFARYRNGEDPPSKLIELVAAPAAAVAAVAAARLVLEGAGFAVVVSADRVGRIVDRLVRPKYNAALRLLDDGLAEAGDMDRVCRLGLGYPDGPIERVVRGGLVHHHDVSRALFAVSGAAGFAPARQAVVAKARGGR